MTQSDPKLPPHAIVAEQGVVGCVLQEASHIDDVQERIAAFGSEAFYDLRHRRVWDVCCQLKAEDRSVDLITVQQRLRDSGELESVGGLTYLNEMVNNVPTTLNIASYLDELVEKAQLRRVLRVCVETAQDCYALDKPAGEVAAGFQKAALEATELGVRSHMLSQREHTDRLIDRMERRHRGKQEITGLRTPWFYLNNMTAGLQAGEMVVVGARPSCGKTAMGIDIAIGALRDKIPVAFYSVEMSADQIEDRMLANVAKVNGLKLRNGFWRKDSEGRISDAVMEMSTWPLYLDDRASQTCQQILLSARRLKREKGIGLVVVDYIQIVKGARSNYPSIREELTEVSHTMKLIAKECQLPVVVMAQLSRDSEKERSGRAPLLSDIKECGAIEQDADVVGLLWEPRIDENDAEDMAWMKHHTPDDPKDNETSWQQWYRRITLTIAKNRNGPTGPCELVFQRSSTRFCDASSPTRVKTESGVML